MWRQIRKTKPAVSGFVRPQVPYRPSVDAISRRPVPVKQHRNRFSLPRLENFRTPAVVAVGFMMFLTSFNNLTETTLAGASSAANPAVPYQMQTGYYMGNGSAKAVKGLGFAPDLVIIKSDAATIATIFKTSSMPENTVAFLGSATAESTAGLIRLDSDGFAVASTANTALVRYTWTAFTGDNCSASGQFCVGTYTGDGAATKTIVTGFQPDLAIVKNNGAINANWRSSAMPVNAAQFFTATAQDTTGAFFTTLNSNGFTVAGATSPANNIAAGTYRYIAFKNVSGSINVGTYTGTGADNRAVTGVGFKPNYMFVKNGPTAVTAASNQSESYSDNSNLFTASINQADYIQSLDADGFTVGTNAAANGSGSAIYWVAFAGAAAHSSNGTFTSASGTYTGNGFQRAISGLGFTPDLIIIKGNTTQNGVFRTSMMGGDSTAYLGAATTNLAGAITAINGDGFSLGTSVVVNTNAIAYYWTAYGNAWRPDTNSGASDFYVGAYYTANTSTDNTNITRLPFQADMVTIKATAAVAPVYRTSAMAGDLSGFFLATAESANNIQALNADGFQIGNAAVTQTVSTVHWYFGFKNGANFTVGTYSGTGAAHSVTGFGLQPDNVWVKQTGAVRGVLRTKDMATDSAVPFINVATVTGDITAIVADGITVGTAADTNTLGANNYRYVAWKTTVATTTPSYAMQTGYYMGNGNGNTITGLGFSPDLVIIKSDTAATATIFKTTPMPENTIAYLGAATADNANGLIRMENNGFTVTGVANTALVRYTWTAYTGSDCTATGVFCVGEYNGTGAATLAVTTGFQPDLVAIKLTTAVGANWRSSAMPVNAAQFFAATTQNTAGGYFTTLNANGFTVAGATSPANNVTGGIYRYIAWKNAAGSVNVGTYTGNAVDNTAITGTGFQPDYMFVKNANAGTPVAAVSSQSESYGDNTSMLSAAINIVDSVQSLDANGFTIGANSTTNGTGNTIYWAAFGGAAAPSSSGTFKITSGTYTGTTLPQSITGLGFSPNLVMIKGQTAQAGVFRTSMMNGDSTAYLDSATANLAGAITSLNGDGFSLGTSAVINTSAVTYYWTAYGNAWNPDTKTGASDFYIGAYFTPGTAIDNQNITGLPFQADMVTVKANAAAAGTFRTSDMAGDTSGFFAATAETPNNVQAFTSDGFQTGNSTNVRTTSVVHWYFGFKTGTNFSVGTYSGTGAAQAISSPAFQPNNLWIKQTGAVRGVLKSTEMVSDSAAPFINVAPINNAVTSLTATGFALGTAAETNTVGSNNYRYVAWHIPTRPVYVTGKIYASDEVTLDTAAYTINVSVNNAAPVSTTAVGGSYFIPNLTINPGDAVVAYIYNDGANEANAYTESGGNTDITGLDLIVNKVTIGNSNGDGTTNVDICAQSTYPTAATPDDRLSACSGNDVTVESNAEFHVLKNSAYDTGASATLTTQGSGLLHTDTFGQAVVSSPVTVASGVTLAASSLIKVAAGQTLNLAGNWTNNGGAYNAGAGTVNFNGGSQSIGGSTATTFYNLSTSGSSNTTPGIATTVGGALAVGDGSTITIPGFAFTVTGSTTVGDGASGNLAITSATGTKTFAGLVTVNTGGTWTNAAANSPVTLNGGITNNGTFNAGTGVYTFATNAQSLNGTISIPNITVTTITVTNNGTLTAGTTLAGTGGFTQGSTATLILPGTITITTLTANAGTNVVNYSGTGQTCKVVVYATLQYSGTNTFNCAATSAGSIDFGGTTPLWTTGGALNVAGNVHVTGGTITQGTQNMTAGSLTLDGGNFTTTSTAARTFSTTGATSIGNGALNIPAATGTKTFTGQISVGAGGTLSGASTTTIFGAGIANNGGTVNLTGAATTTTPGATISGTDPISIATVTVTSPGTLTNSGILTISTALGGTGTYINGDGSSGTLNYAAASIGVASFTASAVDNTVNYTGGAQTVRAVTPYHNVGMSGSGAKTLSASTTAINGDVTLSGTATTSTVVGLVIGGNVTIGDGTSFTAAGFALTVSGNTTVGGGASGSLVISSATGTKIFAGPVTTTAGSTWNNSGNSAITMRGGLTHNGATFTAGSGIYTFDTTAAQSIGGSTALAIPSLTVNTPTVLTNTSTTGLTIATALAGTGGLTQAASANLTLGGTSSGIALDASANGNTVTYNSTTAGQTTAPSTYYDLTINKSGQIATLGGATTVGRNLLVSAGTLNGTADLTVNGNATGAGAVTLSGGTFLQRVGSNQSLGSTSGAADWTFNNIALENASGSAVTITPASGGSGNFTVTGSFTIGNAGDAAATIFSNSTANRPLNTSNVYITTKGSLLASSSASFAVSGDWTNAGAFTPATGTITLTGAGGSTQTLTGDTTFYNLTSTAATARTLAFETGSTTTVSHTWTCTGSPSQHITLTYAGAPGTWHIAPTSPWTVDYVTPVYSTNDAGTQILPAHYTDGGNNINWFSQPASTPTGLTQGKTSGSNDIAESDWVNTNQPWFGFDVTDPDTSDTVKYRIQIDATDSTFTHILADYTHSSLSARGTTFAYQLGQGGGTYAVGSASMTLPDSATGYWWRVYGIDNNGLQSASPAYFGGTPTVDFKLDTAAPTGGTINDGTTSVDAVYNDGSLTSLSAYWATSEPSFTISGKPASNVYEYSIGTTPGAANIAGWTYTGSSGTQAFATATGLTLNTSELYFVSVRAYDVAGNMATIHSNGQMVLPTFVVSFLNSPQLPGNANSVDLGTWQDPTYGGTGTTQITTTTNAYHGYSVYMSKLSKMALTANPAKTVPDIIASYLGGPTAWATSCTTGTACFGYTSNDTNITSGARGNIFGGGSNYCAVSDTAPGDIVADETSPQTSGQSFTMTYKVQTTAAQDAGAYSTNIQYTVVPQY